MKKHRLPFISNLLDYFRQPKPCRFQIGDRVKVSTDRLFWLGGLSNTVHTTKVSRYVVLVYKYTRDNHYHFDVAVNILHGVKGLKNGDRVYISTFTFDNMDFEII